MTVTFLAFGQDPPLRIVVRGTTPPRDGRIESAWADACAGNGRLFDGNILSVRGIDLAGGVLHVAPERFSHLVCPLPGVSIGATILSVTGVVESEVGGLACVLVGRRGDSTRSYPGMWEFAPAGGLHSVEGPAVLGMPQVLRALGSELEEEVGMGSLLLWARVVGLLVDASACSVDVIVRARLANGTPVPAVRGEHDWEYSSVRWVPVEGFRAFVGSAVGGVIEPTRVVARWLGWLG